MTFSMIHGILFQRLANSLDFVKYLMCRHVNGLKSLQEEIKWVPMGDPSNYEEHEKLHMGREELWY